MSSPPVCSGCGKATHVSEARPGCFVGLFGGLFGAKPSGLGFLAPAPPRLRRGTAFGMPGVFAGGSTGWRHTTRRISSVVERACLGLGF